MKTKFLLRFRQSLQPLLTATALVFGALSADAAGYIKFDGVDGESTQKDHAKWCNVESMSQGIHRKQASGSATGLTSVELEEFKVAKPTDRSSPKLMEAVCKGKVFPKVEIHLTEVGADGEQTYLVYELKNVMVTSYSLGGGAHAQPTEELALNYEEIKVIHVDRDGSKGGNVEFEWKVEEGES